MIQQSLTRGIIPYSLTSQGGLYFGLNKYNTYKVAHFNVVTTTASQIVTIGLSVKSGTHAFVDWGDGSALTDVSYVGQYQNYTHTYASAGTYNARLINPANVTGLRSTMTSIIMSITTLTSMTYLSIINTGTSVTGVITGMALTYLSLSVTGTAITGVITGMALTYLSLSGTGTAITGVITGMALTYLYLFNTGTAITGVITGMALTYLYLNNTGTSVTGALSTSSRLTRLYYSACDGTLVIPTIGLALGASITDIILSSNTIGQPSAVIDAILNAASATTWSAPKTITASGNNGAHTSASASALTTLAGLGVTVTVN